MINVEFFHHTLYKNCPKCTKRPTGLDSHQSNMAGRCLHVKLYMEWKLYLKTSFCYLRFYFSMFASINLIKGGGESRIIYTLDPGAKIVNIWQKEIFLCTPLLGISQWEVDSLHPRFAQFCE